MPCEVIPEAAVCKRALERYLRNLDLTPFYARNWEPGEFFDAGQAVRPRLKRDGGKRGATGFEYVPSADGQSGEVEPVWPTVVGQTVADGGLLWTCQAISHASLDATIADPTKVTWTADDGLDVEDAQLRNSGGKLQIGIIVIGAPADDAENKVVASVISSDGQTREFAFTVTVHD